MTDALAVVEWPRLLLPVKDAPVHGLVDTLTGCGDGRGADGGRSLDGLGVDAHGCVFTADCIVAGGGLDLGDAWSLCLFLQLFLGCLQRCQIVTRLHKVVVSGVIAGLGIFSVRQGEVCMGKDDDDHQRYEGDATEEVGQEEGGPAPHLRLCDSPKEEGNTPQRAQRSVELLRSSSLEDAMAAETVIMRMRCCRWQVQSDHCIAIQKKTQKHQKK